MNSYVSVLAFFMSALVLTNASAGESFSRLIKDLGSADFQQRQRATQALRAQPEAEAALRDAMRSADLETRRRIEQLLDYYQRKPVRELNILLKEGRVDEMIRRVAAWPPGKFDDDVWLIMRELTGKVYKLHIDKGGQEFEPTASLLTDLLVKSPDIVKAERITESTAVPDRMRTYFVRADVIDFNTRDLRRRRNIQNELYAGSFVVAAKKTSYTSRFPQVTYSGGTVKLEACGAVQRAIIVSGGDVIIGCDFYGSIVIARGNVVCTEACSGFAANRVIAGKTVKHSSRQPNIISENDLNPLGFIRWADTPKKPAAKGK